MKWKEGLVKCFFYGILFVGKSDFIAGIIFFALTAGVSPLSDWITLIKEVPKVIIVIFLFGAPFNFDLLRVALMITNYILYPFLKNKELRIQEKILIFSVLFATSQLPLDWDLETIFQFYPYPLLIALDLTHSVFVLLNTFILL